MFTKKEKALISENFLNKKTKKVKENALKLFCQEQDIFYDGLVLITGLEKEQNLFKWKEKYAETVQYACDLVVEKRKEKEQWDSLKKELEGIKKWGDTTEYKKARRLLYESILPLESNINAEVDEMAIKEAGEILYKTEGMSGMHDSLLWLFIPKPAHRVIDCLWDGIGEWKW